MLDEGKSFEFLVKIARDNAPQTDEQWDPDADKLYWNCLEVLASRTDLETVTQVLVLTKGDAFERDFSATILGRVRLPATSKFPDLTSKLLEMLAVETNTDVLDGLIAALGHREKEARILEAVIPFHSHPDWNIRWGVTMRLGEFETPQSAELLMVLMEDVDEAVRDWATFGLKNMETLDTPAIRAAFVVRLDDEDYVVRNEALVGLARRGDERAVTALLREIDEEFKSELFDAIVDAPNYELLPALEAIAQDPNYKGSREELGTAINRCRAYLDGR